MKMKLLNLRTFFLVLITGLILSGCSEDEKLTNGLVGTWTAGTPNISIMIGSKTLAQYFIDEMELSPTEAEQFSSAFTEGMEESFTGTVQFKSDNTYTANMGGEPDSGTWSLSANGEELTIDPATDDPMTFEIVELTSSKLRFQMSESESEDLNGDEVPETMTITIDMIFTR